MTQQEMIAIVEQQRLFFKSGATRPLNFRIAMLKKLETAILDWEDRIYAALKLDLGKHEFESYTGEVGFILSEINTAVKHLSRWTKPEKVPTALLHFPGKSFIYSEPLGNAYIIAPWNYPFQLIMGPLVGCICGGNTAVLKPSSNAVHTSSAVSAMIASCFDPAYITVMEIGRSEANALLEEKFDIIFYTGSTEAGKTVMTAAAKNLTPVILELGGKNPCLVDKTADIPLSARRIIWGKFYNTGQTCIAPDYVYADHTIKAELISEMKKVLIKFYGDDPKTSGSYGRIISTKQTESLKELLKGEKIVHGGEIDIPGRYIAPTLVDADGFDSPIMQKEIFGPILPIAGYASIDEALKNISLFPKPLSVYIFSKDKSNCDKILSAVSSGNVCINDTLSQFTSEDLPFGGVGNSGMGKYHGKSSFDVFSNRKSVMKKSFLVEVALRYPPYAPLTSMMKRIVRIFS